MSNEQTLANGPFARVPAELVEHLRPFLDDVVDDVVHAVRCEVPEYAVPLDSVRTKMLTTAVRHAVELLLDRTALPDGGSAEVTATYHAIGRGAAEEGRGLDTLRAVLRLGSRTVWRRLCALTDAGLLPRSALPLLGEAGLVHFDEIAAAASVGYTEARLRTADELRRRRGRLLDLLTADPAAPPEAVEDLARAAGWPVPGTLAVVVLDRLPDPGSVPPAVPPEFLTRFDERPGCVVVPDPERPGRTQSVERALRGHRAVLGPTVPVGEGARSLRWASDAAALMRRGVLPETGLLRCADHLATLLLFRDESLVRALAERYLGPLDGIPEPQRGRLADTLLCWLQCGRNANEAAGRMGVHPQTVRYRLRKLEELFGERLRDSATRFELELVLRAEGALRRP